MAKRTVKAALWRYRDKDGGRRIARFGDEVDLSADELERGEAQNVFNPAPVPAVVSAAVAKAHADIESRVVEPPDQGEAALHHDVTAARSVAEEDVAVAPAEPVDAEVPAAEPDASAEPEAASTETLKRPARAAHVDAWEAYVVAATANSDDPITPDAAKAMTKEQLQAVVPAPKDG